MAQLAVVAFMAAGQLYKGEQQRKLKEREALAYREAADRRMAAATHEAQEERRRADFAYSRALAVAGAQSGRTSDPGITSLLSDITAEGDYRVLSTLWVGETEAEGLRFRAAAARREAESARTAALFNAVTSAVSTYYGLGGSDANWLGRFSEREQMRRGLSVANAPPLALPPVKAGPAQKAYKIPSIGN